MYQRPEFTFEKAFDIQLEHLTEWSKVLKPSVYILLLEKIIEENKRDLHSPYDVCRGSAIDNIVKNLMYKL